MVPIPLYRFLAFIILFPAVLGELGEGGSAKLFGDVFSSQTGERETERKQFAGLLEEKNHAQEEHHMFRGA